jgi:DNA-binding CsgD family transcriptional regulator
MIRVGVLSNNPMIRSGLRALVEADPELDSVPEGGNCDVLIVSGTPGLGRSLFSVTIPEPVPPMLIITEVAESYRSFLRETGCTFGLLPPTASELQVRAAVRALAAGLSAGAPEIMRTFYSGRNPPADLADGGELSPREAQVLQLLSVGLLNKEIAAQLDISEHTVKYHISSIFAKLEATNRVEAIRAGIRLGILDL